MTAFDELTGNRASLVAHPQWQRVAVDTASWDRAADSLAAGQATLLGLWAEPEAVHLALLDEASGAIAVLSLDAASGRFPSLGRFHPPAIRLERAIKDIYGLEPEGTPDKRPWLDHGRWGVSAPLSRAPGEAQPAAYAFLPAEGESLHQVPVGPVHAGIIEPGHFRFTANGEAVVRLEERLGYVHKGIESLMAGAELERAAKLAGRVSGDSTVAYGIAFARAVEDALGIETPPRAQFLRALMAELERLANHLGDIGAICNDAAFALMHAHCGVLRERVLRACDATFGHRLMRDRILPGGVAADLSIEAAAPIRALIDEVQKRFPKLIRLYDETASLQDRTVGTGIVRPALAAQFGAGGYVGRASGRAFDARRKPGYAPYDQLAFASPSRKEGDVNARVWIRIGEVEQSLALIAQLLDQLPAGAIAVEPAMAGAAPREGLALVEGFRGDILVWLRLDRDGRVERCHLRDPSWFQWPLLEAAIEGNIVADFPLCNKSFNCSYSGHDL
jgi:Ni,Fe-hydrogenase III large subunit